MKRLTFVTAITLATLSLGGSAFAQSTLNIGPAPSPQPVPQPSQCLAVTLAGSTFVRICNGGYTAQLGGTQCGGGAFGGGGNFSLSPGNCSNGQQFLGGNLSCNGTVCNWTPSAAGFAAGFRAETVYAQYQ